MIIKNYWKEIHEATQDIFESHLPLECIFFLLFGLILEKWPRRDKYLFNILAVAAKKALTRKWLSSESPTLNMWMDITMDIYKIERLTAEVNYKKDYIIPRRLDFDSFNLA